MGHRQNRILKKNYAVFLTQYVFCLKQISYFCFAQKCFKDIHIECKP